MGWWGKLKKTVKKAVKGKNIFKGTPFEGVARALGKSTRKAASIATHGASETALKAGMSIAKMNDQKKRKRATVRRHTTKKAIARTPLVANTPHNQPTAALVKAPQPSGGIIEAILSLFGLG